MPPKGLITFPNSSPTDIFLTSDVFAFTQAEDQRTRGVLVDAWNLLIEGPCEIDADGLEIRQHGNRTLLAISGRQHNNILHADFDALVNARLDWERRVMPEAAQPALRRSVRQMKGMTYSPEGIFKTRWSTPDRWPHRKCWLWDSAFHAIGMRHLDLPLAQEFVDAVFSMQRDDGFMPIAGNPGHKDAPYTQPPTLALAMWSCLQNGAPLKWIEGHLDGLRVTFFGI